MKKKHLILSIFVLCLSFIAFSGYVFAESSISERLVGRILLQVEDNGEAYYIYPNDSYGYYLGRPQDAFNIMRALGLGITNADLNRIPRDSENWDGEAELIERLKGRILLQTEENGEAWYVYPINGKRYYLGRPADAFQIMRNLGLGINNQDLATIHKETVLIEEDDSNSTEETNSDSESSDTTEDNNTEESSSTDDTSQDNTTYQCGSDTYNCGDFSSQSEAQSIYNQCMNEVGKDIHRLDRDNNGVACESL